MVSAIMAETQDAEILFFRDRGRLPHNVAELGQLERGDIMAALQT
jgi:hypothetical protein